MLRTVVGRFSLLPTATILSQQPTLVSPSTLISTSGKHDSLFVQRHCITDTLSAHRSHVDDLSETSWADVNLFLRHLT